MKKKNLYMCGTTAMTKTATGIHQRLRRKLRHHPRHLGKTMDLGGVRLFCQRNKHCMATPRL
jgi:hypothetical protein